MSFNSNLPATGRGATHKTKLCCYCQLSLLLVSFSTQELLGSLREEQGGSGTLGTDSSDARTGWEAQH